MASAAQKAHAPALLLGYTDSLPGDTAFPGDAPFRTRSFGGAVNNLAITNVFVSGTREIYVWVSNFGSAAAPATVEAGWGTRTLRASADTVPGGAVRILLGTIPDGVETIRITLSPDDALPADNTATLSRRRLPTAVTIVGRQDRHLEKALGAIPGVEVKHLWEGTIERGPAVLLGTACPSLPEGDVAVVNPAGRCGPLNVVKPRPAGKIAVQSPDSELLEAVDIASMDITNVLDGNFPPELKTLVSADGIPAIATMPKEGGTLLYVGFDVSQGNWHTRPSFPIFWYNFFGRSGRGYSTEGLIGEEESNLMSAAGVISRGTEREIPRRRIAEKDLSGYFAVVLLMAAVALWFMETDSRREGASKTT
jgi:hypothetical protein